MKKFTVLITLAAASGTFAALKTPSIVYGVDDRVETFEADAISQKLAASTAGMLFNSDVVDLGDHILVDPTPISETYLLCKEERFLDQATPIGCSGFLVAPDLLVTAGHCVRTQENCDNVQWIFDFKVDEATGKAPTMLSKELTYSCKEVLEAKRYSDTKGGDYDHALIRLDRPVLDRAPLKYRTSGKIDDNADLMVIGHPSGLPQKVAKGANVVENSHKNYFQANLDTFGGNSGSAVFNTATMEVEGILVRGGKDYESTEDGCRIVHTTSMEVEDFNRYGEASTRMTDINILVKKDALLKAALEGDLKSFTTNGRYVKANAVNVYDNHMTSALHIAAKKNHVKIMQYLADKKVDLNLKNLDGNTALHFAAMAGNREAVELLIERGADVFARNARGLSAARSTHFYNYELRRIIENAQANQSKFIPGSLLP